MVAEDDAVGLGAVLTQMLPLVHVAHHDVVVVIAETAEDQQRLLAHRPQPAGLGGHGDAGAGVQVHDAVGVRARHQHAAVDRPARLVEFARLADDVAVEIHLHQAGGRDLIEELAVAVDQEMVRLARHPSREMRIDEVGHPEPVDDPVQRREVAARLPFRFADLRFLP